MPRRKQQEPRRAAGKAGLLGRHTLTHAPKRSVQRPGGGEYLTRMCVSAAGVELVCGSRWAYVLEQGAPNSATQGFHFSHAGAHLLELSGCLKSLTNPG